MSVNGMMHIIDRRLEVHRQTVFCDKLGGLVANNMHPINLAGLRVRDDLNKTLRIAGRDGLADGAEGEFSDFVIQPLLLGGFFGEARARDLRLAVSTARENADLLRLPVTKHPLHRLHGPKGSHVRQPRRTLNIAGRINTRGARLIICADLHKAALELKLHLGGSESVEGGGNPDRD